MALNDMVAHAPHIHRERAGELATPEALLTEK